MLKKTGPIIQAMPDPVMAERGLRRLLELKEKLEPLHPFLHEIALLFSCSPFLTNFSVNNPELLLKALKGVKVPVTRDVVVAGAKDLFKVEELTDLNEAMESVRYLKRAFLLRITLRDLLREAGFTESMQELSLLADVIIDLALKWSLRYCSRRYGDPPEACRIAMIGLGKLGGVELNYSSDVDLMAVYEGEGQTAGVMSPAGVRVNRIGVHRFFCKVVEIFNRLLSGQTESGIGYRVDLRLRPQGQKGDLVLPLSAYRSYYESWGRTWERMVLIRAREVAGDSALGADFMDSISPFVWKTVDYSEIEEIRTMKKRIDSTFSRDDIKRGYGGIREAEFFVQTLQLIYGAENHALRTNRMFDAVKSLRRMGIIPDNELSGLLDSYLYLRRLEHFLQMRDDLQVHKLPQDGHDLDVLARKMGHTTRGGFLMELRVRRMGIKSMYNLLLGTQEDIHAEALTLLEGDLKDEELKGYLSLRGVRNQDNALRNLKKMTEKMALFKTQRERATMRKVFPLFLEEALRAEDPDRALNGLEQFFSAYGAREAYLEWFYEQRRIIGGITRIFSVSSYLSRVLLSDRIYLDLLIEETAIRKRRGYLRSQLSRYAGGGEIVPCRIAEYKRFEEFRIGLFYLMEVIDLRVMMRFITGLAEAILDLVVQGPAGSAGLIVVGMGKFGGRELTFGSDLDLMFVAEDDKAARVAEQVLKILTTYTDRGQVYAIDVRLRPDGSKGTLVKDMDGFGNYYLNSAQDWEVQALLKARPITGSRSLREAFMKLRGEVLSRRGEGVSLEAIKGMRKRIVSEVSAEGEGIDVKFGPGGIGDIEFYTQWLQLRHAGRQPSVTVQNTSTALKRLAGVGAIGGAESERLLKAYRYLRTVETLLRLNEENVVKAGSETLRLLPGLMRFEGEEGEFLDYIERIRRGVLKIIGDQREL